MASSASAVDLPSNANTIPTKQALLTAIDDIEIVALGKSVDDEMHVYLSPK